MFEKISGILYICPDTGKYYVISGYKNSSNAQNYEYDDTLEYYQLDESDLIQTTLVSLNVSFISQQYLQAYQQEVSMLYMMRVAVLKQYLNPLVQILPIFQFRLKKEIDDDNIKTDIISDTISYDKYLQAIEYFQTNGKLNGAIDYQNNGFILKNYFLIPFHVQLISNDIVDIGKFQLSKKEKLEAQNKRQNTIIICAKILLDQSHAFKICYMVLNLIYHQQSASKVQNTNYILANGSQCGKTTYDLSLFFSFMFHPDIEYAPVIVQRSDIAIEQSLLKFNSICIPELNKYNINFKTASKKINLNEQITQQIILLLQAGIKDAYQYPKLIQDLAHKLCRAQKQASLAKTIIDTLHKYNGKKLFSDNKKEQPYYLHLKALENDSVVLALNHLIHQIQSKQNISNMIINDILNLTERDSQLTFKNISNLSSAEECAVNQPTFYIFDEVCFRDPDTYSYTYLLSND
ncbi:Hypothetical_protein [Hexamita inflata]|uniref:Hypothetical_protein n=1 Tax=Hexamita inflata TaxID=28002 RepID=A0AA86TJ28_9EUKA|nr:Hypothetical protein HINF_LOCUS6421 [Hexamita inflata]